MPLHLYEIIKATKGRIIASKKNRIFTAPFDVPSGDLCELVIRRISTDTRDIRKGDLFIALKGEHFDGHNFIKKAVSQGASAIIASRIPKGIKSTRPPIIKVKDTLLALGDIAVYYRKQLTIPVIAVGGSNGKTTTKDMIAHILSKKYAVTKSPRSFNNFIGLPLTILSVDEKSQYLVAEVGTNKPGEIDYLAEILKPDIAVITNISATHLDGLKTPDGVFKEESSLFKSLKNHAQAVFDSTNKGLKRLAKYAEYKSVTFSINGSSDIRADRIKVSPTGLRFAVSIRNGGHYDCFIPVLGSWNVKNALAAFAAVQHLGLKPKEICQALKDFQLPAMRMDKRIKNGITFINDAYNANPVSVGLVINDLSGMKTKGRKILVFGEMRELDRYSRRFHEAAADDIARSSIDMVVAIGPEARYTVNKLLRLKPRNKTVFYYATVDKSRPTLNKILKPGDTVLLKGSRANALEKII
ncbi:MAG: UDP-N-acetylmuramoyl-tripeptide--D-alanyl-D-alanine ligase [Planctomycetes bacterium]|nr:UDP-N-acetylmuramoyl-tripeptide--D-alanyl-D-alanine ligase [Planctomycetota bacterium]